MEHNMMNLHENKELFADAIQAASQPRERGGLGIKAVFIEKDYWICRSLKLMAEGDNGNRTVFKGGTSLTKAYGIGSRFSEDIDIAIFDPDSLNGNQLKMLIRRTAKSMTSGLEEKVTELTSKGSHYYKAFYTYPRAVEPQQIGAIKAGQLLIEINSFANPYPTVRQMIEPFLTQFLQQRGMQDIIEKYDMAAVEVNVLDKCRTMMEKMVSLMRFSLADDYQMELKAKIRHFYDLYFLMEDAQCREYLGTEDFQREFLQLYTHDRQKFDKPQGWQQRDVTESPLLTDFHNTWSSLSSTYDSELPDLAYQSIPTSQQIETRLGDMMTRIKTIITLRHG